MQIITTRFIINWIVNYFEARYFYFLLILSITLANCKSKSFCHLARHLKGQVGVDCLIASHWHFGHSGCHYSTKLDVNDVV